MSVTHGTTSWHEWPLRQRARTATLAAAIAAVVTSACAVHVPGTTETPQTRSLDGSADSISLIASPRSLQPPLNGPASGDHGAAPDADMAAVLAQLDSLHVAPIESLMPVAAREQPAPRDAVRRLLAEQGVHLKPGNQNFDGVRVEDRMIPGAAGELAVRVYHPDGAGRTPPLVVYFHGGGWVIANRNVYDAGARGIAKLANAVVVSVDYRLAPEYKFPAAHDDAVAAYRWVVGNASSLGGDGRRIALAGESAGGNLAVATAIAARDAGMQTPIRIVSIYPVAQTDTMTPSYVANAAAKPLNRAMMSWFLRYYTRTPADRRDPRLDLVHANLRGLPPVTIVNAQIDPLLDDGAMLERALRAAGVSVDRRVWDGETHEFFGLAAVDQKAAEAQQYAAARLREAFGQ